MKKIYLTLLAMLMVVCATAQSPRAVIKSIVEGKDSAEVESCFIKIEYKVRENMPEMYALADAMRYSTDYRNDEDRIHAYELLAEYIDQIRSSSNSEKVLKGISITIDDIIRDIEQKSFEAVVAKNNKATYRTYIALAERAGHSLKWDIEANFERCACEIAVSENSVEACNDFLEEFGSTQSAEQIRNLRRKLLYEEAMMTEDEDILKQFIDDPYFKDDKLMSDVKIRLMNIIGKRIESSQNIEEMREFISTYPSYSRIATIKQKMATIEYPTIEDSPESLARFIKYYGKDLNESRDARRRMQVFNLIERCSIAEIFQYLRGERIVSNGEEITSIGYDRHYPRMQRAIAQKHGYIILSQDITKVELIRFCTLDGKVGFFNQAGKVVVEPQFDLHKGGNPNPEIPSVDERDIFECTIERKIALVKQGDKFGVIDNTGKIIVPANYKHVWFLSNDIICAKEATENTNGTITYSCDVYNKSYGNVVQRDYRTGFGGDFYNWDVTWFKGARVEFKDIISSDISDIGKKNLYIDGSFKPCNPVWGGCYELTSQYRWMMDSNDGNTDDRNTPTWFISQSGGLTRIGIYLPSKENIKVIYDNVIMVDQASGDGNFTKRIYNLSYSSNNNDKDNVKTMTERDFSNVLPISEGLILVQYNDSNGYWGFVSRTFEDKITDSYNYASSFSCGRAAVRQGNKAYLIDKDGKIQSRIYDYIVPLEGYRGLFKVMKDGKYGIVDANDDIVVDISHDLKEQKGYQETTLNAIKCEHGVIEWKDGKTQIFEIQ